jgi:hypothetical protein
MANVPFCSAKQILARVARNTGGRLPSMYHDDILEWIPEGIDLLTNTNAVEVASTPDCGKPKALMVENHVVCMPKDLCALLAIEDEWGRIIPLGGDITDLRSQTKRGSNQIDDARAAVFSVNTDYGNTTPIRGEDLEMQSVSPQSISYYKISGNYIQFSFESGYVKVHYLKRPLDKDGYPLIPDNENFKQALYFYVMRQMLGAGFQHPVFSYEAAHENFELYAARAINELTYPSLDAMARLNRSFVRLVPPYHFYEDFFQGSEQTQQIRK